MFDHVTLRVADRAASERFYDTVLAALGVAKDYSEDWLAEWGDFSISPAGDEHPPTRGVHIGFAAPSRERVEAFHRAGIEAGYADDGAPGPRPEYREDYYGAFLLDPDGNSTEAVHHGRIRTGGTVDHVWIRVADVRAARRFYATIAPHAGFRADRDTPERASFVGAASGTFSVVAADEPARTRHLHMAFPAPDHATVEAFHRAATAAGYTDNGPPGERPVYHPGYYGAFVLDPDGNNIEVVDHDR